MLSLKKRASDRSEKRKSIFASGALEHFSAKWTRSAVKDAARKEES
jgi:hypothetical protein